MHLLEDTSIPVVRVELKSVVSGAYSTSLKDGIFF